jgi:D-xylose 1-dehydrogenase (NADP+, D-xylono-1,5-lactone-forming)
MIRVYNRGLEGPVRATRRVRWGILGTGAINRRFLAHAGAAGNATFVAVGSRSIDRARTFAGEHGIPAAHGSYEALLADPDVDVVYVCLPNALHHRWTMAALAAGKHVLCEKPYSRHPSEVTEAFDAADRAGRLLMEAFMWRHSIHARTFMELLPRIGAVRAIRATFSFVPEPGDDVRLDPALDGGSLLDVGCYCVSGARLIAGREPLRVQAAQLLGTTAVDVRFAALLDFGEGLFAAIEAGFDADHESLEAIGATGTLRRLGAWAEGNNETFLDDRLVPVGRGDPYLAEIENLSAAILGQAAPLLGRADALGQARTIEALFRAAASGRAEALGD